MYNPLYIHFLKLYFGQCVDQFVARLAAKCVVLFGAVDGDAGNAALHFVEDVRVVTHGRFLGVSRAWLGRQTPK